MNFQSLFQKFQNQEAFIHGNSVIQIVDMKTYTDAGRLKTDFIFHTERLRRGIITVEHQNTEDETIAMIEAKRISLQKSNI